MKITTAREAELVFSALDAQISAMTRRRDEIDAMTFDGTCGMCASWRPTIGGHGRCAAPLNGGNATRHHRLSCEAYQRKPLKRKRTKP